MMIPLVVDLESEQSISNSIGLRGKKDCSRGQLEPCGLLASGG